MTTDRSFEPFVLDPKIMAQLERASEVGTKIRGVTRGTTIDKANIPDKFLNEEAKLDIARRLALYHADNSTALKDEPKYTTLHYGKNPNTIIDLANIPDKFLNEEAKLDIARRLALNHADKSTALKDEPKYTTLRYGKNPNTIIDLANIHETLLNEETKLEIAECLSNQKKYELKK